MSNPTACDASHIVLVGMMGVGKSAVGRALASRLDRPLLDTDAMVEHREGRTVRDIWITDGEDAFRLVEADIVRDALGSDEPAVIAAAGGAVLNEQTRAMLIESDAHVVWLLADVELLLERVRRGMHRPALDDDAEGALTAMFEKRAPLYHEVADAIVSVDHRSVSNVTQAVLRCCG